MISKECFVNAINDVKGSSTYQEGLNRYLQKNGAEGYLLQPDCSATVLSLLHEIWGNADADEWISYFCLDLDFGKKWSSGLITAKDGSDIKLETPEDLYDLLLSCKERSEPIRVNLD